MYVGHFGLAHPPFSIASDPRWTLLHVHGHPTAFGAAPAPLQAVSIVPSLKLEDIASSRCGIAGSFGMEVEHAAASLAMGELSLLPAVRAADANTLIVADGTSCRHQIHDGAQRTALHVAQVMARALQSAAQRGLA
jgi:Fe-S oxidoreductase